MKKLTAMVLAAAMSLSFVAGCGVKKENKNDDSVVLKWVVIGPGKQKDADMVITKFNEKLNEYMPGTSVDLEVISDADYSEKWNLMMATNEEIDIAWTGYAVDFNEQMQQGSYMALDELIEKYGADMKAELPEWLFDLSTVDGKIYAIPNYQMMATWPKGLRMLKEHSDKYFDRDAIMQKYLEWENDFEKGKEFYGLIGDGLQKMKDAGVIGQGVDVKRFGKFTDKLRMDTTTVKGFSVDMDTFKVEIDAKSDYMKLWYDTAAEWYKKGYIRSDILSAQNYGTDSYRHGFVLWSFQYDEGAAEREGSEHNVVLDAIPLGTTDIIKNAVPSTATVIPRTSKNPEKAMQLLNLLNSKKGAELYNLLTWGIEGTHYEKENENRIITPYNKTQGVAEDDYGIWNWALASIKNSYENQAQTKGWTEYVSAKDEKAEISPVLGFKPDTSKLATEIAQFRAVEDEYQKTLSYGAADNHEALYKEYIDKLDRAGGEKIREELQRQLDEWVKQNK